MGSGDQSTAAESPATETRSRLRWFQFRLWHLFALVTVVALGCSWLAWKMHEAKRRAEAVAAIEKVKGRVAYDFHESLVETPPVPDWLLELFGTDFFADVETVSFLENDDVSDAELELVGRLTATRELWLFDAPQITDVGLGHLRHLTRLEWLNLWQTRVTDEGIEHLRGMTQLRNLCLGDTGVTDASLEHIAAFENLDTLWLQGTRISDAGLERIGKMTQLEVLGIGGPFASDAGLAHIRRMPNLSELTLEGPGFTDAGLVHLRSIPNLDSLSLFGPGFTEAGVEHLQGIPQLRKLTLYNTRLGEIGEWALADLLPDCDVAVAFVR